MVPISLPGLRLHSIFLPSSSSPTEDDWEVVDPPSDPPTGRKTSQLVMWDKDLLVAIGSELRMTSLSGGEGWEVKGGVIGSYKVDRKNSAPTQS